MKAPIPANETERLKALRRYEVLDTAPEREFDDIVLLASHIFEAPIALLCFVDEHRQWFKSKVGTRLSETPREIAFSAHGILQSELFVVEDAREDERFADNPLVVGESGIRFCAGAPLITEDGYALGMLCVSDHLPRKITGEQKLALQALSRQVIAHLKSKQTARHLEETIAGWRAHEAELSRKLSSLSTVISNLPDAIYIKDTTGRKTMVNPAELRLMGCRTEAEALAKSDFDIYPQELAAAYFADDQAVIQSGQPLINREEKVVSRNGEVRWVLSSKIPLSDNHGTIIGIVGLGHDITEKKVAETKLDQAHKELVVASRQAGMAEVATNVLHNVGNVLNSVNVSCTLISDKVRNSKVVSLVEIAALLRAHENDLAGFFTTDPRGKKLPNYLSSLATHLAEEQVEILDEVDLLVSNIVHIKEIVTMQQSYAKASGILELINVTDLVEDALRLNSGAMIRHNVKIAREFADVAPILTEKHKVLQILVNLLRNAKYACDDSGHDEKRITLRVANGDGRVKISVIDNGVGIPPENLTRIFSHGFTTKKDGHGFGLHSGALAANELGGTLRAFSEGPGRGAAFTLELPVKTQEE